MNVYTDIDTSVQQLIIKGNVIPTPGKLRSRIGLLLSSSNTINFGSIYHDQTDKQSIEIENPTAEEIEIELTQQPEFVQVQLGAERLQPGQRSEIEIAISAEGIDFYGELKETIGLELSFNDQKYSGRINIFGKIVEDFSKLAAEEIINSPRIYLPVRSHNLGQIERTFDKEIVFEYENRGKNDLVVRNVQINNNRFKLVSSDEVVRPGETGVIILAPVFTNTGGSINTSISLICNDPKNSENIIQILGSITAQEKNEVHKQKTDVFYQDIDLQKAWELTQEYNNAEKFAIIDVRTPEEYKKGHIPQAVNFDINDKQFEEIISILDNEKLYLVYCETNQRSKQAIEIMRSYGFKNILNLIDGFVSWQQKRLPVEASK